MCLSASLPCPQLFNHDQPNMKYTRNKNSRAASATKPWIDVGPLGGFALFRETAPLSEGACDEIKSGGG